MDIFENPPKQGKIIFLGEGNFSFSAFLEEKWRAGGHELDVISSCYESAPISDLAQYNVESLKSNGAEALFNVDATKLDQQHFDLVIFMFPHIGGKMKIQKNRYLLKNFAISVQKVIKDSSSRIIVTLCNGQGGTPYDSVQRLEPDSWQIVKMMSFGNLGLVALDTFDTDNFPGYQSFGYRSQDKGFHCNQGTIHVFKSCSTLPRFQDMQQDNLLEMPVPEVISSQEKQRLLFPPQYCHDLSFWLSEGTNDICQDTFDKIVKIVSQNCSVIDIKWIDTYFKDNLTSKTVSLTYQSDFYVMSANHAFDLHQDIGKALSLILKVKIR
jgi:hypothetical protein